jgi:hypothetical protein
MKTLLTTILLALIAVTGWGQKPVFQLLFNGNGVDSSGNAFPGHCTGDSIFSTSTKVEGTHSISPGYADNWESKAAYTITDRTFTISFNVYSTFTSGQHIIFSNRENSGTPGFDIEYNKDNNRIYGRTSNGVTTDDFYSYGILSNNKWQHFVIEFNGQYVRLYLDGFKQTLPDSTILTDWTNNNIVSIGTYTDGISRNFQGGYIDNFHYYSYGASSSQADSLYFYRATNFMLGNAGGSTPSTYSPLAGRHVRFFSNGIEKKDKYSPTGQLYWNAKSGATVPAIYTMYDGVCPSGANRITDHDCADIDFSYANPRKIKSSSDYSNIVYIDPSGSNGDGTITTPYNSWTNVLTGEGAIADNTAYLFKSGTTLSHNTTITPSAARNNILFGSYGTGDKPKIVMTGATNVFNLSADSVTIRDLDLSIPNYSYYFSGYMNPIGITIYSPDGYADGCDIYNCDIHNTGEGILVWGGDFRIIGNNIYDCFLDGIFLSDYDYCEISYNHIYQVNTSFDIPEYQSDQNYSPGDGLQIEDHAKESWIHNNIIDKSTSGNKQTIMYNDRYNYTERLIIEYNELINPLTTGQGVSGTNINGGTESPFGAYNTVFAYNTVYSKPGVAGSPATGLYIAGVADSIYGNVFYNCNNGILNAWHDADIISNNTFFANNVGVYNAGTVDKFYNNIFWLNGTNYTGGTFTSELTNLTSIPVFLNQSGYDFHLTSGSTGAIDQGTAVPFYKYDRDKNVITGTVDIGAYEYIP